MTNAIFECGLINFPPSCQPSKPLKMMMRGHVVNGAVVDAHAAAHAAVDHLAGGGGDTPFVFRVLFYSLLKNLFTMTYKQFVRVY